MIFQLRVELIGLDDPAVWRQIVIPERFNFQQLHEAIQVAMGWEDCHLFRFDDSDPYAEKYETTFKVANDGQFGLYESKEDMPLDPDLTAVENYLKKPGQVLNYLYDFGDNWEHRITLEARHYINIKKPQCLDGGGKCPPENICGVAGYKTMLQSFSEDGDEDEKWFFSGQAGLSPEDTWDPHEFNVIKVNDTMACRTWSKKRKK